MNRWFAFYLIMLCCGVILFPGCKDDLVQPGNDGDTTEVLDTTSHVFEWEVDTLFSEGTTIPVFLQAKAMYGTSATNVYLAGYSTSSADKAWHWDGQTWSTVPLAPYVAGSVNDIDGIDASYIVFAGEGPGVIGYTGLMVLNNGTFELLPLAKGDGVRTCIHVVSRNEIYLGGVDGIQMYNGMDWEWMLDSTETTGNEFYPQYIHKFGNGDLEFVSQRNASGEKVKYYQWQLQENRFVVQDTFSEDQQDKSLVRFGYRLYSGESDVFSTGLGGTYKRVGHEWDKLHDEGGLYVAGTENDLIIGWSYSYVWHYNGSTKVNLWKDMVKQVPSLSRINAITYIDNVLFVAGELSVTRDAVIIRGRHSEVK